MLMIFSREIVWLGAAASRLELNKAQEKVAVIPEPPQAESGIQNAGLPPLDSGFAQGRAPE
jgi:hypothetical protein